MSRFTRNRKKTRLNQATERKQKEINHAKFEKAMQDHIKTCRIIKKDYPGYEYMSPENRLNLYNKIYNEVHKS